MDNDLQNSILQYKTRLKEILQRLQWSEDKVLKDFNSNSVASSQKVTIKLHSPVIASYPESCITTNSLVLETPQLQQVLQNNEVQAPRNFKELQVNFSREQKLKIYEHVIENTEKLENNNEAQVAEGEISLAEILAQKKREEKRKKRRFRKSKPTHIEEVRCLVDLQMQALQQFMGNKTKKDADDTGCDKQEYDKQSYRGEYTKGNYREERNTYEDYYKRNPYRYRGTEQRTQQEHFKHHDFRRRPRSRSTENKYHESFHNRGASKERKRRCRSRSKELSYDRKRSSRSHSIEISYKNRRRSRSYSRERRRHNRSRSKEISYERTRSRKSHSKERAYRESRHDGGHGKCKERRNHRSRSRSKERRKHRSRSKDIYHEKRKQRRSRSKSYERLYQREKDDYNQRHYKGKYYEISGEKSHYQEQYRK